MSPAATWPDVSAWPPLITLQYDVEAQVSAHGTQCAPRARRLAGLPGPKHTAEGYVLLAWLQQMSD